MNNLSPRDTLLVLILVNIICYWIGYQFILTPLLSAYNTTKTEYETAIEENKSLKYEAEQESVYDTKISDLKKIRRDEVNSKFYQTVTSEKFHKWFTNLKKSSAVNLTSFNINRKTTSSVDSSGETVEVDFVDNNVTLNFYSTYDQMIDLLKEIEEDGKASALTNVSIAPEDSGMIDVKLVYSFYSITKNDGEDDKFTSSALDLGAPNENKDKLNLAK